MLFCPPLLNVSFMDDPPGIGEHMLRTKGKGSTRGGTGMRVDGVNV